MDTVSEFHAEEPQATASEGLAQGPYLQFSSVQALVTSDCPVLYSYAIGH